MPRFDQTGPLGQGMLTGRGLGPCGQGKRLGRGFGFGRGLGKFFGWNSPQTEAESKQYLESYRQALKEELEDVESELVKISNKE